MKKNAPSWRPSKSSFRNFGDSITPFHRLHEHQKQVSCPSGPEMDPAGSSREHQEDPVFELQICPLGLVPLHFM